jgi:hypothetical protein
MLKPKKMEIRKKYEIYKTANTNKKCHKIERNPLKDGAMEDGHNSLF